MKKMKEFFIFIWWIKNIVVLLLHQYSPKPLHNAQIRRVVFFYIYHNESQLHQNLYTSARKRFQLILDFLCLPLLLGC